MQHRDAGPGRGSLAQVLAALSVATDVGNGLPAGRTLRVCLLAVRIARELGVDSPADLADVYFLALLRSIACTSFAPEQAELAGGDDIAERRRLAEADSTPAPQAMYLAHWDVGRRFAERLDLGPAVLEGIGQVWERFDGHGQPHGIGGDALPPASRIVHAAGVAEAPLRELGPAEAVSFLRRRSGGQLDPAVVAAFETVATRSAPIAQLGAAWDEVLAAEPDGPRQLTEPKLDAVAEVFADFADLKSRFTPGHSRRTAAVAAAVDPGAGRAALFHDLGRVAVPTGVWDKPGPLNALEWDLVRAHPTATGQIIGACEPLAAVASHAAAHHETPDGTGYPRGVPARMLPFAARVVAAASAWSAMTADRAHRPALTASRAADELRADARLGRFDPEAVDAVLAAVGVGGGVASTAGWRTAPTVAARGLTDRETEVLRLLTTGWPVKQVARSLGISYATARHHVEHIYEKLGVASRAGAVLAAVEHGVVDV